MADEPRPTTAAEVSFRLADVLERIERSIDSINSKVDHMVERLDSEVDLLHAKTVELDSRIHALEVALQNFRESNLSARLTVVERYHDIQEHVQKDRRGLVAACLAAFGLAAAVSEAWGEAIKHWVSSLFGSA